MQQKSRFAYFHASIICIILGLTFRKFGQLLPLVIAENAGDVLWAMMVYFGFRFFLVGKCFRTAILLSLLFCFGIEFSQLYQVDWMNQIRSTLFGALVLGKGFLPIDLLRYTTGILIGTIIDKWFLFNKWR